MNDTCCCTKNQALLTTEEAALYLGVPVSYLICARSPKCPGCLVPPPKFVRLRVEKKGAKWVRYPRIELDRWLASLPLREKTEIAKTDNEINKVLADVSLNSSNSKTMQTTYTSLQNTISNQRLSVSGVDEDEEAQAMVQYSNSYTLASKMIQTLTEIYDRLILETGV